MKYKFEDILKGKKTYITAILIVVLGLLEGLELFKLPGYAYIMLGGFGLGSLRAAVNVFAKSIQNVKEKDK